MSRLTSITLAAGSGILLALAFPKVDLGFLAWIAFVPLLWVVRRQTPKQAFFSGWIAGLGFYLCTLYWIVHTIGLYSNIPPWLAVGPLVLMCAILASYTGAFVAGLSFYRQWGGSIILLGPVLWTALEWVRSFFFIGFPWVNLGYSQHANLNLIQFTEATGVYGLSALVIFINLVVFSTIYERSPRHGRWVAVAMLVFFGLSLWGGWRREQLAALPPAHRLRVALIQGNIAQDQKWDPAYQESTIARYEQLSREAARQKVDLIVWPEAAVPFFFQSDVTYQGRILRLARELHTPLLFGSPAFKQNGLDVTLFNRAYLLSPTAEVLGLYDKMQLAPFGEYVPFHDTFLFFLDKLVVGIGDFAAGTTPTVFSFPQTQFGVLICYEGIFPALARRFVAGGATLLVNITNDAWFGRTSAPYQHLVMEAMRAVENRVPLVRAANTGFSAVIDLDGRIRTRTELYEPAVIVEELAWPRVESVYATYGDIFVWTCTLVTLALLGYGYRQSQQTDDGGPHANGTERETD